MRRLRPLDLFRYLVIERFGGLYLDLDVELTSDLQTGPLREAIAKGRACFPVEYEESTDKVLRHQGFRPLIGQYAFYAPPGHPFLKRINPWHPQPAVRRGAQAAPPREARLLQDRAGSRVAVLH